MAVRLRLPSILLFVLAALLAACGTTSGGSRSASQLPSSSAAPSVLAHSVYPLALTDDAGRRFTLSAAPRRIVSLAPSNTEIVCALQACADLGGGHEFHDYPVPVAAG